MGWRGRGIAALAVTLAAVAAPVSAAPPVPATPGWTVSAVRLEPVDGPAVALARIGEFRGSVEVRPAGAGLAVVNHVALEDYLLGISEVPVTWPLEAQKAQAVAARTYALYEAARPVSAPHRAAGADICATQACQVYVGVEKERRPGSGAWAAAVAATKGQVLQHQGRPILAKYSSSNGGRSVAGGQPYLRSVDDPDDRYSPLHSWRAAFAAGDVARVLGLSGVPLAAHRAGDDIVLLMAADGSPAEHRVAAADFRSRLNAGLPAPPGLPLAVPSNRFDVAAADGTVVVDGRGWGHGIGLSQYGALGKAARGMRAEEILASYYGGIRPVTVPPEGLPQVLKVAVALAEPAVTVEPASRRFRVLDGSGNVLAHAATGAWSIQPAGNGMVRVLPASNDGAAPTASVVATEPATPAPGAPLSVRLRLDGPAAVTRLQLTPPGGAPVDVGEVTLRPAGGLTVHVARPAAAAGTYRLEVERDAGGGRTTTSVLAVDVGMPPPLPGPETADRVRSARAHATPDGRGPAEAVAVMLLAGTVVATARVGRARRRPLH